MVLMAKVKSLKVYEARDFRKWLEKNNSKEKKVELIVHKKHTGKPFPSHRELMEEAICFGWIDTVIRKVDDDTFIRTFQRRGKNSRWSYNTLKYGKQLIKEKRMAPAGLHFYKEGLKKKPHDYGIPRDPDIPEKMKKLLDLKKNKNAKDNFEKLSSSARRTYLRWIFRAKRPETKMKRIGEVLGRMSMGEAKIGTSLKVNG